MFLHVLAFYNIFVLAFLQKNKKEKSIKNILHTYLDFITSL
jgi:hypothetical protein